jgi:hypothetical protein
MLVIMMSPSIFDTIPKMATTCEQKEEKNKLKHQETKDKTKTHFKIPELDELRVKLPHVSNYNGTSCCFF